MTATGPEGHSSMPFRFVTHLLKSRLSVHLVTRATETGLKRHFCHLSVFGRFALVQHSNSLSTDNRVQLIFLHLSWYYKTWEDSELTALLH